MSGHSKWSKIKHKKAATDAKKSKEFSKIVKMLKTEARLANGDINSPNLRVVVDKAKAANMPKENIERAIARAAGVGAENLESVTYETYGPGGSALIIETSTDSRNRTAAEIKHTLSKQGFELASPGAAAWAFSKKEDGWVPNQIVKLSEEDEKKLVDLIESLEELDDTEGVYTNADVSI